MHCVTVQHLPWPSFMTVGLNFSPILHIPWILSDFELFPLIKLEHSGQRYESSDGVTGIVKAFFEDKDPLFEARIGTLLGTVGRSMWK